MKEIVNTDVNISINGVNIDWDLKKGTLNFLGISSTLFWNDPSLLNMFKPLVDEIGREMFNLQVSHSSSLGTKEDYQLMITQLGSTFEEGFCNWGKAVSGAGWGTFELKNIDYTKKIAKVIVHNPWELSMQKNLKDRERWGCPFIQGKIIGVFQHALGGTCWADELYIYEENTSRVEFEIYLEEGTIEDRIVELRKKIEKNKILELKNIIAEKLQEEKLLIAQLEIERDRAKSQEKAKSEFLANMSHEIRTPLNAISGFLNLLKAECNSKALEYVKVIDDSSKDLIQIIEDILDFSKIENGKLDIEKIDFNAKSEFEVITYLFEAKCVEKNLSLTLQISDDFPSVLNGDPLRIKQVILNLISNAVKFTPEGKNIVVLIEYNEGALHVSVKDEGIGIAPTKVKCIFDAFAQADNSTTRKYGGTGLGLSISSALIQLLEGELKVESEEGVGSEFYFSIPIRLGKSISVKGIVDKDTLFTGKKVLLVEDNKSNQLFMDILLDTLEITSDIASDGIEAVSMFKLHQYDMVLMDENMPNMNGIEATKHILEFEKEKKLVHTPIVALTANALKGDRERFLASGMDEYLSKPVDKQKLRDMLKQLL